MKINTTEIQLLNRENISIVPNLPGVYEIYAFSENGEPLVINRFAKKDLQGLLYIGRTINLHNRLYNFLLSSDVKLRTHNHSGALKYKERDIIRKTLKKHSLCFQHIELNENEIKEKEKELLDKYAIEFGEYPLLNT